MHEITLTLLDHQEATAYTGTPEEIREAVIYDLGWLVAEALTEVEWGGLSTDGRTGTWALSYTGIHRLPEYGGARLTETVYLAETDTPDTCTAEGCDNDEPHDGTCDACMEAEAITVDDYGSEMWHLCEDCLNEAEAEEVAR